MIHIYCSSWLRSFPSLRCPFVACDTTPTDFTMAGIPHSVLSSRWLCSFPLGSTCLSRTSTPTTLGFMGLGYFLMAAVITVSQGWLHKHKQDTELHTLFAIGLCPSLKKNLYFVEWAVHMKTEHTWLTGCAGSVITAKDFFPLTQCQKTALYPDFHNTGVIY